MGGGQSFDRVFGVGYFRKKVASASYSIDQAIVAPFGDDPVLLSQVTIANRTQSRANLRWIEYWGCHVYQFSFRSFIEQFGGGGSAVELRRKFGDRFTHSFRTLDGNAGLLESKQFPGRDPKEEELFQKMKTSLATHANPFLAAIEEPAPEASFDDLNPPGTFLASLDAPADGFTTDAKTFFGAGRRGGAGSGLAGALDGSLSAPVRKADCCWSAASRLTPASSVPSISFMAIFRKGRNRAASREVPQPRRSVWKDSSHQWKDKGLRFETKAEPWVKRETAWHYYYLRSSLTYDDFFGEHILSQGGIYQYSMGFQGAARDPLQHALPFLFSDPEIVKEILRYTLKEVRPDGSIPYGIVGHGTIMPVAWITPATCPYGCCGRPASMCSPPATSPFSTKKSPPGRLGAPRRAKRRRASCSHVVTSTWWRKSASASMA